MDLVKRFGELNSEEQICVLQKGFYIHDRLQRSK